MARMPGRLGSLVALGLAVASAAVVVAAGAAAPATYTEGGGAGAYGPAAQPWVAHAQEPAPVRIGALMAPGDSFDDTQRIQVLRYAVDAFNSQSADVRLDFAVTNITRGQELAGLTAAYSGGSGPSYYIGPTTSAGLESITGYADANGVLLVSPASDAAQLAVPGDNTFRLTISVSRQASVLAGVMSDAGATEAVTVIRDDAWGSSFNSSLGEALAASGIVVRGSVAFEAGGTDWAAVAEAVNRTASLLPQQGPGAAVVFAGFGGDYDGMAAALSAAAAAAAGGQPGAAGSVPWFVPSAAIRGSTLAPIPDATTRSFSASVNLTALNHDVPPNEATAAIEANLTSAVRLPYYEYATYDSVFVLGHAIRMALAPSAMPDGGQPDPVTVKAAMPYAALAHEGALGRIALDPSGDLLTPDSFSVWQVNGTGGWARAAPGDAAAAAATPVVDIGMLALLANGHEAHRVAAARLAVNDYNWEQARAAGPDGAGHYLYLRVYNISVDDSPPRAIDGIMAAGADGVSYVVGPSTSGNTQRVLDHANNNNIILVSPSATAPSLSIEGDSLFRLAPDDNRQGIILANVIDRDLSAASPGGATKGVVVVARDDPWGRGLNSTAAGRLAALGAEVSPIAFRDGADWQSVASQIASAAASLGGGNGSDGRPVVLFLGLAPDFEGIASHAGTSLEWYGPDSLAASASLAGSEAARTFADAVNLTATLFHAEENAVQSRVRDGLAAAGVSGLRVYDYSTYDSVGVLGAAIASAAAAASSGAGGPVADPADVRAAMPAAAAAYEGALGDLALNAAGDLRTPDDYALWTMEDGAWKRLEVFRGTPVVEIGALVVIESDAFGDRQRLEAMRLAADEYNRANEAGGPMYIDIVEVPISISPAAATGMSPPAAAAIEAAYANGSGPSLYAGPSTSANAGRVLDFANRNGLTLVSPSSSAPSLAVADDALFRLVPSDARQGVVLADIIHSQQGGMMGVLANGSGAVHVAAVVRNDSWGLGLYDSAAARLGTHNVTVSQIVHQEHGANWSSAASRLNASVSSALLDGPVVVLHVGFRGDFAALAAEAGGYPALRGVQWYGTNGVAAAQLIIDDAAAQGFADAVNLTATKFDAANGTRLAAVDAALRARGVQSSDTYVYSSYDAVLVLAGAAEMAMEAAGGAQYDPSGVRAEVRAAAAAYEGAVGDIELNRAGDLRSPNGYAMWTVEDGAWKRAGMHPATPVIDIGALLVLDGNPSWSDAREMAAMELAVDDFNTGQELAGDFYLDLEVQRIRLSPGHVSPDPDALAGLEAAYANGSGPSQYVGPSTSANAGRVLDFANRNNLTLVSPSSTAPSLAVANDALFRLIPSQDSHAAVLAQILGDEGVTDVVVAVRNDAWGIGANASLLSALPNGTRAAGVAFAEAGADWAAAAGAIGAAAADARSSADARSGRAAVVFVGFAGDFVAMAEQAGARGALGDAASVAWFGAGGIGTSPLVPASPGAAALARDVNLTTARFAPPASEISARLDPAAEYGPSAYDSVRVLGEAIRAAIAGGPMPPPPPPPADVRAAVTGAALAYRGALGNIVLDGAGDLLRPATYGVYEVGAGGEWALLRTASAPPPPPPPPSAAARCPDGAVRCATIGELYAPEVAAIDGGIHEAYALAVEDYNAIEAARQADDAQKLYVQIERAEFSFDSPLEGLRAAYANGSGPQAYLGPTTSHTAEAIARFAGDNGIVLVSPSSQSTSPPLVQPDTLFRLSLNDRYEADLIAIAASREGVGTIIPVIRNDSYGRSYHAEFVRESRLVGIDVLDPVIIRHSVDDLSDEAAELNRRVAALGAAPGGLSSAGLFVAATGADLGALAAAAAGYPLLSSVVWFEPGNLFAPLPISDPATLQLASRAQLVSTSWVVPQTERLGRVHDALLARTGSEPHQFSYAAYDAVFMLADAINRTAGPNGTYAGAGVAAEIPAAAGRLDGLLGDNVALDANGDRHSPSSIIVWKSESGTGAWAEDMRVHLPEACEVGLGSQSLAFGSVAAGTPSPALAQTLVNTGTLAIESVSASATPWTAPGSASEVLAAGATEIMAAAGGLPWTPLGGSVSIPGAALGPLDSAEIMFRLNAPAGVPQSAAGPIAQSVTYAATCG